MGLFFLLKSTKLSLLKQHWDANVVSTKKLLDFASQCCFNQAVERTSVLFLVETTYVVSTGRLQ
jgi:hypothetical protein